MAFLCLATISLPTAIFSVWRMEALEKRLQEINMQYIPFLRVLSQLENHQFLFEYDVNRALLEKRNQLDRHHADLIKKKLSTLIRSFSKKGRRKNEELEHNLKRLQFQFEKFLFNSKALLKKEITNEEKQKFSKSRALFKAELHRQIKTYDKKIRLLSLSIQKDMSNTLISIIVLFTGFLVFLLLLLLWVEKMFRPLQNLTELVRNISQRGLWKKDSIVLQSFIRGKDEISMFSQEFNRMASSLIGRTEQLEKQKEKLEKAHKEMTKQNEELRKTKTNLIHQEKLGLIGKLSAQMAHEIRNPLNAISLHLESLEFDLENIHPNLPESKETVSAMKKEIKRLSNITHSYLELAKKPQLQLSSVNINTLLQETLTLYTPLLKDKDIALDLELEKNIPPIQLDSKNIKIVIGNLIRNSYEALENTKKDARSKKIKISSHFNRITSIVELVFSDTGTGISQEDRVSVFSPFFTTKAQGTGLGLSHSKQIVDAHAGEIYFGTAVNLGTSFYLHLPSRKAS